MIATNKLAMCAAVTTIVFGVSLQSVRAQGGMEQTISTLVEYSEVDFYNGLLAWSRLDPDQGYRLVVWRQGKVRTVPIRARSVRFDVDLGPDERGRDVAVYSRCREERVSERTARGCRLYRLDLASGREVRIRGTSRPAYSEVQPSIWRGRVAFARYRDPDATRYPVPHRIYVRSPGGSLERVNGGSFGVAADPDATADNLDLVGTRLVFGWGYTSDSCGGVPMKGDPEPSKSEVWTARLGTPSRRVAQACSELGAAVYSPTATRTGLEYDRSFPGGVGRVTADRSGRIVAERPLPAGTVSFSGAKDRYGFIREAQQGYEVVLRLDGGG
jgi:hypothetical protein